MKNALVCIAVVFLWNLQVIAETPHSVDANEAAHFLYVETNDFHPGMNAVLAYRIDPSNGSLSLLGSYSTRGAGIQNFDIRLGPDDHDQEVIISPDKRFLLAVNGGSNTIAVFKIQSDGSLVHVKGSPFSSHGPTPTSLGMVDNKLFVINANNDNVEGASPSNLPANYTVFHVTGDGQLEHVPGSTIEIASDANPTQAAVSADGKFVFGLDFFAVPYPGQILPFIPSRGSQLESFQIQRDGVLVPSPGSPYLPAPASRLEPANPATGYVLGLLPHPTKPILYVGEVLAGKLGVYTYNEDGVLSRVTDVDSLGLAICWIATDPEARWLYTSDSASNSIGVFDISNPLAPVSLQEFSLRLTGSNPLPPAIAPALFPTLNFQLSVDPTSKFLYVTNHAATPVDYMEGNVLHILQIAKDGTLTEPAFSPVQMPVDGNIRPTGNAIR